MSENFTNPNSLADSGGKAMQSANAARLARARDLVLDGDRAAALSLVVEALRENLDDPEALYLYATLTPDSDRARQALQRLLGHTPHHEKARALLQRLDREREQLSRTDGARAVQPQPALSDETLKQIILQQQQLLDQLQRQGATPHIRIDNAPTNTVTANVSVRGGAAERPPINLLAQVIGFLMAFFLVTFGVAHMINGRLARGLFTMAIGWFIYLPLAGYLMEQSKWQYGWLALILHLSIAYGESHAGARED